VANLPESNVWEAGIYQLETTDPLMAGANGVDNFQAKQLANRTVFLKNLVGNGTGKILTLVAGTAQTLAGGVKSSLVFDTIVRDDASMLTAAGPFSSFALPSGFAYASFKAGAIVTHTPGTSNATALLLGGTSFSGGNTTSAGTADQAVQLGASFATPQYAIAGGEIVSADVITLLAGSTVANTCYFQIELYN